jgi:hypothetical protein
MKDALQQKWRAQVRGGIPHEATKFSQISRSSHSLRYAGAAPLGIARPDHTLGSFAPIPGIRWTSTVCP